MSIDEWVPDKPEPQFAIDGAKLEKLIAIDQQQKLDQLTDQLAEDEQQWLAFAMKAEGNCWLRAAGAFGNNEIVHLIRTLAIAEMRIPGCTVGASSPIISLNRLLKQRGASLSREDLLWHKQHSTNRFIPNGPIL